MIYGAKYLANNSLFIDMLEIVIILYTKQKQLGVVKKCFQESRINVITEIDW